MFFYLFLLIFSFQTRILIENRGAEFTPTPREMWGFIEWNSAFFYLSDIFIAGFILFWIIAAILPFFNMYNFKRAAAETWRKTKEAFWGNAAVAVPLSLFFIVSVLSAAVAQDKWLAFFSILKIAEFILFFFAISYVLPFFDFKKVLLILLLVGISQGIIADLQWHYQTDIGLKIFGESPLGAGIAGVAKIDLADGSKLIRPYGTFPHPNVLAAFLLLCVFSFYYLYFKFAASAKKYVLAAGFLAYFFLIYVLFLTFSRLAISAFITGSLLLFGFVFWERRRGGGNFKPLFFVFCAFLAAVSFFSFVFSGELSARSVSFSEQSVSLRLEYAKAAWQMAKENPFLGVSAGNFVRALPGYLPAGLLSDGSWVLQPVHNIYLLILAETGIFGLLAFVFFLSRVAKRGFENLSAPPWRGGSVRRLADGKKQSNFAPFFILFLLFLALGFFDHYFWTIQQGRIMFWFLLAIVAKNFAEDYNEISPERKSRS